MHNNKPTCEKLYLISRTQCSRIIKIVFSTNFQIHILYYIIYIIIKNMNTIHNKALLQIYFQLSFDNIEIVSFNYVYLASRNLY